jgi:DNA-binding PadR family transcriptional regulator
MTRSRLSELECFVLGLVWERGPCSPYDLRRHMLASPSTQWSASAGAIYPLVRRLRRRQLLASAPARTGRRRRLEYRVTSGGVAALRAWIGPPLAPEAVTVSHDPLRSRARFLKALSPARRRAWVRDALEALARVEARVHAWHARFDTDADPVARLLSAHARRDLAARRAWLADVRRLFGS